MNHVKGTLGAIVVFLTTAALLTGCAATQQPAPHNAAAAAGPTIAAAIPAGFNRPASGGAGGGGSSTPAASLPATWPRDVPVPAGKLIGSTGSTGRWTVLLLEAGPAAQVLKSAAAFYKSAGYTAVSGSVLNKGTRHITLVVENRDHSASKTYLVIQLTTT
jgi:hypothetical protein